MKKLHFNWKELETEYNLVFEIANYINNGNIYIGAIDIDNEESFCDITINIPMYFFEYENEVILDNDIPSELVDLLEKEGFITFSGKYANSGFARYKVVRINEEKFKEYSIEEK